MSALALPPFQRRVMEAALPACARFGLALAGGHAVSAHGFPARSSHDIDLATAAGTPLPEVAGGVADALGGAGLRVVVADVTPRLGRMTVRDPVTGQSCEVALLREALQRPSVIVDGVPVVSLDDAVGLKMRALHERSLARDIIDIASVSHLYGFRELERMARLHNDEFSPAELAARLEFVELIADEDFECYGLTGEGIGEIRRLACAWVEDIGLRRADEGDAEYDDVPDVD